MTTPGLGELALRITADTASVDTKLSALVSNIRGFSKTAQEASTQAGKSGESVSRMGDSADRVAGCLNKSKWHFYTRPPFWGTGQI